MTALEKMKNWLLTFPHWDSQPLYTDYCDALPDTAGLYPLGLTERYRREDVTGRVQIGYRVEFMLCRITGSGRDNGENARWLLQLQDWIGTQSAAGLAPKLGDVPQTERIRAEKGRLKSLPQTGTARYAVTVTADFIKYI